MYQEFINNLSPFTTKGGQIYMAIWETILMIVIPGFFAVLLGGLLGLCLYILRPNQQFCSKGKVLYSILDSIVNIGRSVPFIILMIAILPLTRLLIGTTIGTIAACVPLTITAIPFMARIVEHACLNVGYGVIEAAHSMGANTRQILLHVILPESRVNIINGIGLMLVTLVGYSAMAGTLAGGGLGALAFNYGYQRFDNQIIIITVVLIILLVHIIQYITNKLAANYLRV